MIKCKGKESCGPDAFLPYQPAPPQASVFLPYVNLGCPLTDGAARCFPFLVFHPCKVWTRDSALSTAEHSLARNLQIWLSSPFIVGFCVAHVNGE